jgi:hypothetical protein
VTSKVTKDDHDQLLRLLVVNDNTRVGVGIELKFSWFVHEKRIPWVSFIGLGTFLDMVTPEVSDGLGFDDPVVFRRIGGF